MYLILRPKIGLTYAGEAVLTSTHTIYVFEQNEKNNLYPLNPSFTI